MGAFLGRDRVGSRGRVAKKRGEILLLVALGVAPC